MRAADFHVPPVQPVPQPQPQTPYSDYDRYILDGGHPPPSRHFPPHRIQSTPQPYADAPITASSSHLQPQSSVQFTPPPSSAPGAALRAHSGPLFPSIRPSGIMSSDEHRPESSSADEVTPIFGPRGGSASQRGGDRTVAVRDYKTRPPEGAAGGETMAGTVARSDSSAASSAVSVRTMEGERRRELMERRKRAFFFKKIVEKYGTIELDNKGSTARDHLALERTFLAWLRTSLAFASIGIAVTQLFRLNTSLSSRSGSSSSSLPPPPSSLAADAGPQLRQVGKPLGATFLGIAIVVLFVGFHRYFESQHWIIRGKFPASRGSVALVALVAAALIVGSLVVVVTVDASVFER